MLRGRGHLEWFLGRYFFDPAVGVLRAAEADLVASRVLPGPLLDLGCGDGSFASAVLERPAEVGLDRDLSQARRALASGAYRAVVVADAHRLPFRDGCFASVLSNSTLEHIPGVGDVLREVARVQRPRARLLFTVHNQRFAERMYFWPRVLRMLRLGSWIEPYRTARLRRLAMVNLMRAEEWQLLLDETELETVGIEGYLRDARNDAFERLLVLSRLGCGRLNLGAALRLLDRALVALGVTSHRRTLGRALARILRPGLVERDGPPAALLIETRRRLCTSNVIPIAVYERDRRCSNGTP